MPTGYAGWFWHARASRVSTDASDTKLRGNECGPKAPLAALMEVEV